MMVFLNLNAIGITRPQDFPKIEALEERSRETPYWALERGATKATKSLGKY